MMDDLFRWAAEMQSLHALPLLLKVTLLACIGRLLIAALPRVTAAVRFGIAMITLAGLLVLPLVMVTPVRIKVPLLRRPSVAERVPAVAASPESRVAIDVVARALPSPVVQPLAMSQRILENWRGWLLMTYIGVAALAFGRLLLGILALRRVIRGATVVEDGAILSALYGTAAALEIEHTPLLVTSTRADVPVMWGLTHPVLILPAAGRGWTEERLRVVFLHELAHWQRRDVFALLLMRVATAIYWFHPVIWSLERIARRECERACDDVVLAAGTRASEYADHLLAIARSMPRSEPFGAVTVAMSRPAELEGRLLAILQDRIRRSAASMPMYATLAAAMLAIAIPLGAMSITYTESDVRLGVIRGVAGGVKGAIDDGVAGGVSGGVADGVHDGVKGGVHGGVAAGVKSGVRGGVSDATKSIIDEWYRDGSRAIRERRFDEGIELLSNVIRADPFHASARYNLACAYALRGDSRLALRTLRDAIVHGYGDAEHMLRDEDLASIRGPEMDALAGLADELTLGQWGGDWPSTIPRYQRIANDHPDIDRAWFNLGYVLAASRQDTRAIEVYKRVLAAGYRPGTSMYNLACSYAHLNDRESALQWLRQAEAAGFDVGAYASHDSDLDNVRDDPWLQSLIGEKDRGHKNKEKEKEQ